MSQSIIQDIHKQFPGVIDSYANKNKILVIKKLPFKKFFYVHKNMHRNQSFFGDEFYNIKLWFPTLEYFYMNKGGDINEL